MENDARGPLLILHLKNGSKMFPPVKINFGRLLQQKLANDKFKDQRIEKHFAYN